MIRMLPAAIVIALAAHVFLGWMWSPIGAVLAGFLVEKKWLAAGSASLMAAWGVLMVWSWTRAPHETQEMWRVVADLLGNLPPIATVVATLAVACLLGMAGGWLGAGLYRVRMQGRD